MAGTGSWKSDLKLEAQRGGKSRPENGSEERTSSSKEELQRREKLVSQRDETLN